MMYGVQHVELQEDFQGSFVQKLMLDASPLFHTGASVSDLIQ